MSNFFLLLKIRLDELFELSAIKTEKSLIRKIGGYLHKLIKIGIFAVIFMALYYMANFMGSIGLGSTLPIISYIFALVITFLMVVLKLNETFSGNEDSEFLLSTPIGTFTQVFVTFIIIYGRNLIYTFLIEYPFYLAYTKYSDVKINTGRWLVGFFFTSLPICGIATLIGMVLILSLVHSPKKNQIISLISLTFMAIAITIMLAVVDRVYLISSGSIQIDSDNVTTFIITELSKNLKFARFYQNGIVKGELGFIILFIFMSLIWYTVLLFMHTMAYQSAVTALRSPVTYGEKTADEILAQMNSNTEKFAMLKKELSQFVGSKSYMLHSIVGIILGVLVPINFLIIGTDGFAKYSSIIPFVICLFVGMSNSTYCALSMEGRRFWILETSPSSQLALKMAKVMVNLIFVLPMAVFAGVASSIAFHCTAVGFLLNIIIPVIYSFISAFYGITIDVHFVNYSAESEEIILNRGTTFLLGYLPVVLVPLLACLCLVLG